MLIGYLDDCEYQVKNQNNNYFNDVIKTIKDTDFSSMADGTYEIKGKNLYYHLVSYDTKEKIEPVSLEMHKKYIDFFYILSGKETINYVPNDGSYVFSSNYDADNDVEFFKNAVDISSLIFNKGMFAIFSPGELHISGITAGRPMPVRKMIFKVLFS